MVEAIGFTYGFLALGTVVALLWTVGALAWSSRDRWFGAPGTAVVAGGAFRTAPVTTAPRRQNRRYVVIATGVMSVLWGVITLFGFIPAGSLAGLIGLLGGPSSAAENALWLGLGAAALIGLPMVFTLVTNATLVVQRDPRARRFGYGTAAFVALHHAALIVMGTCAGGGSLEELGSFTAIAASPGLALASMIALSAHLTGLDG